MKIYNIFWMLLIAVVFPSCTHNQTEGDEYEHNEKLHLTAYNNNYEVFVVSTPFVINQESEVTAHFTRLENFKPLKNGQVSVKFIVGNKVIQKKTADKPIKAGIYHFHLTPKMRGNGKLIFDINTSHGDSQIVFNDIQVYEDEHTAAYELETNSLQSTEGVIFTKEQSWKVDFKTERINYEPFGQVLRTVGQVQSSQNDEHIIVAKASGLVAFQNRDIVAGKEVKAGESLFSIQSGGMADKNIRVQYNEAKAEYIKAKTEYERKSELVKDNIVSQKELIEAETLYKNAKNIYDNLQKNFSAGNQFISSPVMGYVKQVLVNSGEYVEAGQSVLVVSQNRDLRIKANLQPKYFNVLGAISSANIKLMNSDYNYESNELEGKLVSYGKSTDLQNPLIPVLFKVENRAGLVPGSFVELFIKLKPTTRALTVPNEGIIEEMGTHSVFIQITPELFEKRVVKIGKTDGYRTEITEGISANERVVTKGAIFIKLSQNTGELDAHDHSH